MLPRRSKHSRLHCSTSLLRYAISEGKEGSTVASQIFKARPEAYAMGNFSECKNCTLGASNQDRPQSRYTHFQEGTQYSHSRF